MAIADSSGLPVLALLLSLAALSLALWAAYQILPTRQDVWLSYSTQASSGAAPVILAAVGAALLLFVAVYGVRRRRS